MGHMQEILWRFIILAYIKTYFESKGTQARRKKKDPAIWKTLSKNKRRIQVSVLVISLQRFYGFYDFMRAEN